ncbi:MAG: hypothetical protein R6V01_09800 [Thermoplasmatota archaeon]
MKINEWMDLFKKNISKKILSLNDLKVLADENKTTISVQLSRLSRMGMVKNPVKGWYLNPFNSPSMEELSMVLRAPSYLSMEYALSRHGILSQDVHTYTLVTTKLPHTYGSENDIFEYHQIKRSLFWGYETEGNVNLAEPEKALLDLIYIRYSKNKERNEDLMMSMIDDMYIEDLEKRKLLEYSRSFDNTTNGFISKFFE